MKNYNKIYREVDSIYRLSEWIAIVVEIFAFGFAICVTKTIPGFLLLVIGPSLSALFLGNVVTNKKMHRYGIKNIKQLIELCDEQVQSLNEKTNEKTNKIVHTNNTNIVKEQNTNKTSDNLFANSEIKESEKHYVKVYKKINHR